MNLDNYQVQSGTSRSVYLDNVRGRECVAFCITAEDKVIRWGGRPRGEIVPKARFRIGDTVEYKLSTLIPAGFDAFHYDGTAGSDTIFGFHQGDGVKPCCPCYVSVHGDDVMVHGNKNNGDWYSNILRRYVPDEWIDWRIVMKWTTDESGTRQIYLNEQLVNDYTGNTCAEDIDGAPYLKIGLQQGGWERKRSRHTRLFAADIDVCACTRHHLAS